MTSLEGKRYNSEKNVLTGMPEIMKERTFMVVCICKIGKRDYLKEENYIKLELL